MESQPQNLEFTIILKTFTHESDLKIRVCKGFFLYFSTNRYVVGTQKNHLNKTV